MWALTSTVKSPSVPRTMLKAVSKDCECKKLLIMQKKPRKNTTKASRRARNSIVLRVRSTTSSVIPASRPSRVLWVNHVAAKVAARRPSNHHRPGNGRLWTASQPRHSRTVPAHAPLHNGRWGSWGIKTEAMTSNRNKVSRLSRGRLCRRVVQRLSIAPMPPGKTAYELLRTPV